MWAGRPSPLRKRKRERNGFFQTSWPMRAQQALILDHTIHKPAKKRSNAALKQFKVYMLYNN